MNFDSAQTASSVLGCEGEELHTAVFKHHLRQLLQRATGGSRERNTAAESEEGEKAIHLRQVFNPFKTLFIECVQWDDSIINYKQYWLIE